MEKNRVSCILLTFLVLYLFSTCHAIWLTLPSSGTKCVSEEIHHNVVVLAQYILIHEVHQFNGTTVSAKVTSPYGNNLYHKENTTYGDIAFTAQEAGNYIACFWVDNNQGGGDISLHLDWKIGVAAKDWDSVAKKEKIEGVELELRKIEGYVEAIRENLIYLKGREEQVRTVSETTNARVAWFSIMSLGICIVVSVLQLWHLKRYFQKKKLI